MITLSFFALAMAVIITVTVSFVAGILISRRIEQVEINRLQEYAGEIWQALQVFEQKSLEEYFEQSEAS